MGLHIRAPDFGKLPRMSLELGLGVGDGILGVSRNWAGGPVLGPDMRGLYLLVHMRCPWFLETSLFFSKGLESNLACMFQSTLVFLADYRYRYRYG